MNERIHYNHCPVCSSSSIKDVLRVKDHTVSGELFTIAECGSCTLRFTQDVPGEKAIAPYYKSEDYISHSNTAKGIVNRLYRVIRTRTMTGKRKLVQRHTGKKSGKLLDVGSGVGSFVNEMTLHQWQATGLEPDAGARERARQLYSIALADIKQFYDLPAGNFDAITLWHVLEHVHDLSAYVRQLKNLLAENGRLFIAVPNYTSVDAKLYQQSWAAYDVPRHLYHFSPRAMEALMEQNGLRIIQYLPMWYDSFYISLLSSRYKTGQTNWPAAAWHGLRSNLAALGNKKRCSSVIYVIGV